MSGRGPQSSQVGLFSTQISEQIVRLRALSKGTESGADAQAVELRRAVMATRLLAGSARILNFPILPAFLDELLGWLQSAEKSAEPMSTTQTLILESVIELEESLMLQFDEDELGQDTDLEPYREQIEDLLSLIQRNREPGKSGKKSEPAPEPIDETLEPEAAESPVETEVVDEVEEIGEVIEDEAALEVDDEDDVIDEDEEAELSDVLELTQDELQRALDRVSDEPDDLASLWDDVAELVLNVQTQLETLARQGRDAAAFRALEKQDSSRGPALEKPESDPVLAGAYARLRQSMQPGRTALVFRGYGGADAVHESMHENVSQLLQDLAGDIAASIEQSLEQGTEPGLHSYHVSIELRADEGAVHAVLSDDAPRSDRGAVFGETDHLALLAGLRRARVRLAELGGLIRVEPEDAPQQRYGLTLPLDPERPRYTVFRCEGELVAVPSTLMEGMISTAGLLYTSDLNGDSFEWAGRQIPLADLSHFVAAIAPPEDLSPQLAVFGSVEKRLALPCDGVMELHESPEPTEAPVEWRRVAREAFLVDGAAVPVLDVSRLLRLRFRLLEEGMLDDDDLGVEEGVDSYVPVPEQGETPAARGGRAATRATAKRVLLVNQSEFRRKDLSRTLQGMGFTVTVSEDLAEVSEHIKEEGIELLVTDLRLGKEGSGSLKQLRESHPDLMILLTSSVAGQYADELARKTGANQIWLDPYRKSDLQALLSSLEV